MSEPSAELPRPVRNNNPLDIESGQGWLGLLPEAQMSAAQAAEPRFAVFKSPVWGFRAGAMLLRNYGRLHGINTMAGMVDRLAPPGENDTAAYLAAMEQHTGLGAFVPLDPEDPKVLGALLRGFAWQEAGAFAQYWSESQIDTALAMLNGQGTAEGAGV